MEKIILSLSIFAITVEGGGEMIPEIREKLEIRIKQTEMKIAAIYNKYGASQAMDIKDIEDIKRYSEIIDHLVNAYINICFVV